MLNNYFQNILIKFGLWLGTGILIAIIGISNVFGLTISDLKMYYTDYNGNTYNDNTLATAQWGAYYTTYVNHNFGGGLMFDTPDTLYAFFNSGQGCSNKNCILTGVLVAKTDNGYSNNTLSSVRIQIEQSGAYKNCSVVGSSMEYNTYSYLTFQCAGYNLNSGFNIVFSQFSAPSTTFIKYGIPLNDYNLQETATTDDVIVNDNKNTQNIINNQNNNTQNIINNQNANTQAQIDSQRVCNDINERIDNSNYTNYDYGYLNDNGTIFSSNGSVISDYIKVNKETNYTLTLSYTANSPSYCLYNDSKALISCQKYNGNRNITITTTSSTNYIRFSAYNSTNDVTTLTGTFCQDGNQALDDSINNLNDNLNDDDTDGATGEASDFFEDFTTNTFGLTSIITAPLNLIQSLTSTTCTDLQIPLPYLDNKHIILPCMTPIYQQHFGSFLTIYQIITYGIIAYWVIVRIFNQVKDFKNPEHDEIEVVDL